MESVVRDEPAPDETPERVDDVVCEAAGVGVDLREERGAAGAEMFENTV